MCIPHRGKYHLLQVVDDTEDEAQGTQPTVGTSPANDDAQGNPEDDSLSFGKSSVELRGGLTLGREFELLASGVVTRVGDISVSGVCGWVSIIVPYGGGIVRGRVFVPKGVQAYLRPPIPVPSPLDSPH